MSNCIKKLKTGFVANDNWQQAPGLDLLHNISVYASFLYYIMAFVDIIYLCYCKYDRM